MSTSDRNGDVLYTIDGEMAVTACRGGGRPMPPCAYCETESTRARDAPAERRRDGRWGRCARRMCETHAIHVGEHHDLCREHAGGDHWATVRAGDTAQKIHWEVVETKALPIPGTSEALTADDRIPGVLDPDDEAAAGEDV